MAFEMKVSTEQEVLREIVARLGVSKIGHPTNGVMVSLNTDGVNIGWLERVIESCVQEIHEAQHGDEVRVLRRNLLHHLDPHSDPCQGRGVDWPCDVAAAFREVGQLRGEAGDLPSD